MTPLIKQADYVLSSCGRPIPPPCFRWVDLPYQMSYIQVGLAGGTGVNAARVENKGKVPFMCRGVSILGTAIPFRIWWPDGRNLEQILSVANFTGAGAGMRTLQPEVQIEPGGKIIIETQPTNADTLTEFYFWGVLRHLLSADGSEPPPYNPDISRAPRIIGGPNQNLMANEWQRGDQCGADTPAGFLDEPFTLQSIAIANPVGSATIDIAVEIPADCDYFVIRNIQYNSVADDTVTAGRACVAIRMPDGYSLTNGDYIPSDWTGPIFPVLVEPTGGRMVLDVADMDATGTGNITTVVQFDGAKRRKLR